MSEFTLKERADFIEVTSAGVDPGVMAEMYITLREHYADGMTLVRATPKEPFIYEEIKVIYAKCRDEPDFSVLAFFEEYFDVPEPNVTSHEAAPGRLLEDYVPAKLLELIVPKEKQGHFGIGLPHDFAAAGVGRFSGEPYHWDLYHIARGYAAMGEWDKVADILYNTEYEINTYGHPLNGGSEFYATRAQPDYFGHMIRLLADEFGSKVLVRFLPALEKDHMGYWMDGMDNLPDDDQVHTHRTLVRMPDGSFLNRYWDDAEGPRLESHLEDVETAEAATKGLMGKAREIAMKKVYKNIRAAAASGWDFSSRWFKDGKNLRTINTTEIAPIDLNSLLTYNEETLSMSFLAAAEEGGTEQYSIEECFERADKYAKMARQRKEAINTYLWDPKDKLYRDYNFETDEQTDIVSAATVYPLYVGIADREQALGVAKVVKRKLLHRGGIIASTTNDSGEQWDGKNVWAPPHWAAVQGLGRAAGMLVDLEDKKAEKMLKLTEKARDSYVKGIRAYFKKHRSVPEKHRGDKPKKPANGGEYELVSLLGMSLGVFRSLLDYNPREPAPVNESMAKLAIKHAILLDSIS